MHQEAFQFVAEIVRQRELAFVNVVEIGSYNVNGSIRQIFFHARNYIGVDTRPGPGVDVVGDGAVFAPDFVPDVVVCMETLEHAPNWRSINRNAYTILAEEGVYIVTAAGPDRIPHGCDGAEVGEEFYENIQPADLAESLQECGFAAFEITEDHAAGDLYAWALKSPGDV